MSRGGPGFCSPKRFRAASADTRRAVIVVKIPKQTTRVRAAARVKGEEPTATAEVVPVSTMSMQADTVVNLRRLAYRLEQELKNKRAAFASENADLISRASNARAAADDHAWQLRQMAINRFAATGDKHPLPGVDVRTNRVPKYDRDVARAWAYAHDVAMAFDAREFEKLARARPAMFDFIEWEEQPQGLVASNLHELVLERQGAEAAQVARERGLIGEPGSVPSSDSDESMTVPPGKTSRARRKTLS